MACGVTRAGVPAQRTGALRWLQSRHAPGDLFDLSLRGRAGAVGLSVTGPAVCGS